MNYERNFRKPKLIKNYSKSTMSQEKIWNFVILSIENSDVEEINFEDVVNEFSTIKSRKFQI